MYFGFDNQTRKRAGDNILVSRSETMVDSTSSRLLDAVASDGTIEFPLRMAWARLYARAFRATLGDGWPIDHTGGSVIFSSTKAA